MSTSQAGWVKVRNSDYSGFLLRKGDKTDAPARKTEYQKSQPQAKAINHVVI